MDTGVLYGEMIGSWLLHLAIPVGISSALTGLLVGNGGSTRTIIYVILVLSLLISTLVQMGFLTFLQAYSCGGVKNFRGILAGTLASVGITALFLFLPAFIDGLRLTVSQLFIKHLPILTEHQREAESKLVREAVSMASTTEPSAETVAALVKKVGLTPEEYEGQTLKETVTAMSYMSAFAGAYGIGVGSFYAAKCKPNVKDD
jgi:hypothetical protein